MKGWTVMQKIPDNGPIKASEIVMRGRDEAIQELFERVKALEQSSMTVEEARAAWRKAYPQSDRQQAKALYDASWPKEV